MTNNTPPNGRQNTCVRLKDVTEEQMRGYFESTGAYHVEDFYSEENSNLIAKVASESSVIKQDFADILNQVGGNMGSVLMTTFLFAFQLGRDFEIREMARAMREERP